MRFSFGQRILGSTRLRVAAGGLVLLWVATACTERNPDFDPLAYCERGQRLCSDDRVVLICQADHHWPAPDAGTEDVLDCWDETRCSEGLCVPDQTAVGRPCNVPGDCDASRVCTILINPDDSTDLGTWCILPPFPSGRAPENGCNAPEDCQSGRCTRSVCFGACQQTSDCVNPGHECLSLNLTIDGVQINGSVMGCVPP